MSTAPLPLAQPQRRTWNAKTALERHQSAYHLWEASLRLLGSVAVARYAELKRRRKDLGDVQPGRAPDPHGIEPLQGNDDLGRADRRGAADHSAVGGDGQ